MAGLRTFIAIELEKQIIDELAAVENLLKESQADVKWVKPSNIHITLKFLGYVQEEKIEKISRAIKDSLPPFQPFKITLENIGAFPNLNAPRIIWVGAQSEDKSLEKLARSLEDNLVSLHFAKEKRSFKSHITIGRIRSNKNRLELVNLLQDHKIEKKEMIVTTVTLFKSILSSQGPHYERLSSADLGKPQAHSEDINKL